MFNNFEVRSESRSAPGQSVGEDAINGYGLPKGQGMNSLGDMAGR